MKFTTHNAKSIYTEANNMNILKLNVAVFSSLLFLLFADVDTAAAATGVNLAPVAEPSTSHVSRDTSLAALHDGQVPKASDDRSKGSYGNWREIGTQWVQYDWTAPVRTRKIDVFWWDDRAGVRLPKACRLLYWDGKRFVPVSKPSGLGVAKDQFNTTTFDEVRTTKLRLEIDGNGDYSTGILEWKVYNEGKLPNFPPSVTAGGDRIVMHGRKTAFAGQLLRAISTATTKVTWSKASGPGKVVFADDAALATTATFSAVGDYVLKLTARKGKMSDSSTLAVRVVGQRKNTELSYSDLVARMYDMKYLASQPIPGEQSGCFSSWDRGARYDEAAGKYVNWHANGDGGGFMDRDGTMMKMDGPGVIWRIWSAMPKEGSMKIFIDGAETPTVDGPFIKMFDNKQPPYDYPSWSI